MQAAAPACRIVFRASSRPMSDSAMANGPTSRILAHELGEGMTIRRLIEGGPLQRAFIGLDPPWLGPTREGEDT